MPGSMLGPPSTVVVFAASDKPWLFAVTLAPTSPSVPSLEIKFRKMKGGGAYRSSQMPSVPSLPALPGPAPGGNGSSVPPLSGLIPPEGGGGVGEGRAEQAEVEGLRES